MIMDNIYSVRNKVHSSQGTMRFLVVVSLMLFCFVGHLQAQCYEKSRSKGVEEMQKKQYNKAIQWFQQAQGCSDKPADNDLDAKIKECENLKAKALKDKKESDEKRRQQEEEVRLREEQERLQREFEEEQEQQMARMSYMQITDLNFVNVNKAGNVISNSDILYWQDIKYMQAVLQYNGLADDDRYTTLYCRIINPDGYMSVWADSPEDYSDSCNMVVKPGYNNEQKLTKWGSQDGGAFTQGTYLFEVYNQFGILMVSRQFTVMDKPPTTVKVTFTVEDAEAEIYVDGIYRGKRRSNPLELELGKTYRVETRKASHTSQYQVITADKNMNVIKLATPIPIYGSINVDASKKDVDVSLDGNAQGKAPMTINNVLIGDHTVTFSKNKYGTIKKTVNVKEGQFSSVYGDMKRDDGGPWLVRKADKFSYVFMNLMYGSDNSLGGQFTYCRSHLGFYAHYMHGYLDDCQSISSGPVLRLTSNGVDVQLFAGPAYNRFLSYGYYYGYGYYDYYYNGWMCNMGMRLSWKSRYVLGLWDLMGGMMTDFDGTRIAYVGVGVGLSLAGTIAIITTALATK